MLLKLCALVLGDGAVVPVALDDAASVGELRQALCREQQFAFPASKLQLFEARDPATIVLLGDGAEDPDAAFGGWLRAADPLVRALKKGAAPPAQLLDEDREMDPTFPLADYFAGDRAPKLKEIHVLVLPPDATPALREAAVLATPESVLSTRSPAAVAVASPATPGTAQTQRTLHLTPTPTRTLISAPPRSRVDPVRLLNAELRASLVPVPDVPKEKRAVGRPRQATKSRPSSAGSDRPSLARSLPSATAEPSELPAGAHMPNTSTGASSVSISNIVRANRHTNAARKLNISTWNYKASALFFFFHPDLGDRNFTRTCDAFGIIGGTFRNWVTKSEFFGKWVPLVQSMTLRDAMANVPDEVLANFQLSELHPDAKVTLPGKFTTSVKAQTSIKRLHSDLQTWSIESQEVWSRSKRLRSDAETVGSTKTFGSGRIPKYQDEEAFLIRQVRVAWETGESLTTAKVYALLREAFVPPLPPSSSASSTTTAAAGEGDASSTAVSATSAPASEERQLPPFAKRMRLDQKQASAALSQWTGRRLDSNNWTVHARQVSPKVPTNWHDAALQTSEELREIMRDVEVLVSADELFVEYYARVAPGAGGVDATSDPEDDVPVEKVGCTVVMGCELFSSSVLPPFTIMAGAHEDVRGTADGDGAASDFSSSGNDAAPSRRFDPLAATDGRRSNSVRGAFSDGRERAPPAHWMGVDAAKQYVAFLAGLYPNKQIGLIWDTASSHVDEEVREYIAELGMVVAFIPPGLGAVMQVCDRVFGAKRVVQSKLLDKFDAWKFAVQAQGPMHRFEFGMLHPVEGSRVLQWIDEAVARLRELCGDSGVERAFRALGQDPRSAGEVESEFREHLQSLSDESITSALTETQLAVRLE